MSKSIKVLVFSAMCIALASVTSMIKVFECCMYRTLVFRFSFRLDLFWRVCLGGMERGSLFRSVQYHLHCGRGSGRIDLHQHSGSVRCAEQS